MGIAMERRIFHLHIPAFPIAVARLSRSELRDRPVAVAPLHAGRAVLLCVSQEAREEGVFKGMPLDRARKRCPGLALLPYDPLGTEAAFQGISETGSRYTPLLEPSRPGHLYLDLTGTGRLWGPARDAGERLRREIAGRFSLSAWVGVAGNKMVSSLASRMPSGAGVTEVLRGKEAAFMAPLRVGVLPGIGRIRQRLLLEDLNITRVRDLVALGPEGLRLLFGGFGGLIYQRALGIDPTPVRPPVREPMVREEITFAEDENDDERLLGALQGLAARCGARMREREIYPKRAGLVIRYADQRETRGRIVLPLAGDPFTDQDLDLAMRDLFFRRCTRRMRVRSLGICFWDLRPLSGQLSLFPVHDPGRERHLRMDGVLDRVRGRYGEGAIRYGTQRVPEP